MEIIKSNDVKVTCPHCGGSECFEEDIDGVKSWLCTWCGFTSNETFKTDSEIIEKIEEDTVQIIRDLKFEDKERGLTWYPSVINNGSLGMIYPLGTVENWRWSVVPIVAIPEEERENYPIPGVQGEFYAHRIAMDQAKFFDNNKFFEAIKELGMVLDLRKNKE